VGGGALNRGDRVIFWAYVVMGALVAAFLLVVLVVEVIA
jgi:hypothetical protein